jgi:hypothetical protein
VSTAEGVTPQELTRFRGVKTKIGAHGHGDGEEREKVNGDEKLTTAGINGSLIVLCCFFEYFVFFAVKSLDVVPPHGRGKAMCSR